MREKENSHPLVALYDVWKMGGGKRGPSWFSRVVSVWYKWPSFLPDSGFSRQNERGRRVRRERDEERAGRGGELEERVEQKGTELHVVEQR